MKTNLQGLEAAMVDPGSSTPHTALAYGRAPAVSLLLNSTSLHAIRLQPRCLAVRPACAVMPTLIIVDLQSAGITACCNLITGTVC